MSEVVICVITCQRPKGLARLLDSIETLERSPKRNPHVNVVVVDNDPAGSARAVCEERPSPPAWHHEPRRGIPFARNTAWDRAGNAEFLAFIDDDEVADPRWLDELLRVQQLYDADVVAGPVLSDLGARPPQWATAGGFFERPRHATGAAITNAFTGNVLFRKPTLAHLGTPFNEEMALMGGSDAFLSRRLVLAGARMVWANDAVVTETVPPSRQRMRWLWRRAFRAGVSRAYTERRLSPPGAERVRVVAAAPLHVGRGVARLPLGLIRWHHGIAGARDACYGIGLLAGSLGYRFDEYTTVHGG